jgi:hypothetical protein
MCVGCDYAAKPVMIMTLEYDGREAGVGGEGPCGLDSDLSQRKGT